MEERNRFHNGEFQGQVLARLRSIEKKLDEYARNQQEINGLLRDHDRKITGLNIRFWYIAVLVPTLVGIIGFLARGQF